MKKTLSLLLAVIMCVSLFSAVVPGAYALKGSSRLRLGDTIYIGQYEQDGRRSNGKEDILWQVLDISGDEIYLISVYALDQIDFDNYGGELTWDTCTLRTWLNDTFYNEAFDANEKTLIIDSYVTADKNSYYDRASGRDTIDKIFLPSIYELRHYYRNDEGRTCHPTAYLKSMSSVWYDKDTNQCWYTTRTTGMDDTRVALVHWEGGFFWRGDKTDSANPIRPAMRISASALANFAANNSGAPGPDATGQHKDLEIPYDITWLSVTTSMYVGKGTIKRLSWHVFDDGGDHGYGTTSSSKREQVTLLGQYYDVDGELNYLVSGMDGYWFWVRESRLRSSP